MKSWSEMIGSVFDFKPIYNTEEVRFCPPKKEESLVDSPSVKFHISYLELQSKILLKKRQSNY